MCRITGYSREIPLAPRMVRAVRQTADRPTELLALTGVLQCRLERLARGAHRAPHDAVPGLVQAGQRTDESTDLREHRIVGQAHIVQDELTGHRRSQRQLVLDQSGGESGRVGGHDEPANTVIGLSPDHGHIGHRTVGDPHLRPVQDPVRGVTATIATGPSTHVGGIGAVVGLGQAEAPDGLAGGHRRQPLELLLLRAVLPDREHRR